MRIKCIYSRGCNKRSAFQYSTEYCTGGGRPGLDPAGEERPQERSPYSLQLLEYQLFQHRASFPKDDSYSCSCKLYWIDFPSIACSSWNITFVKILKIFSKTVIFQELQAILGRLIQYSL